MIKTTGSDVCWQRCPEKPQGLSSHQGEGGRTLVWCMDPPRKSRGASETPGNSASRSAVNEYSLSQVLEAPTPSILRQYSLSAKSRTGVLVRAEKHGKVLPEAVIQALQKL